MTPRENGNGHEPKYDARDYIVTQSTFDPKQNADTILAFLKTEKTTGQLVFHLASGGIQKVEVIEKSKVTIEEE